MADWEEGVASKKKDPKRGAIFGGNMLSQTVVPGLWWHILARLSHSWKCEHSLGEMFGPDKHLRDLSGEEARQLLILF